MTDEEAVSLIESGNIHDLAEAADALRRRLHPENIVTFIIDRNINYTNVCISKCRFCAFYRTKEDKEAYVLSKDEMFRKIEETVELEGTQIMLQGGLHPELQIDFYEDLLESIKSRFSVTIHSFGPPEIAHISRLSGIPVAETIRRLHAAGLDSLPGGGAEILVDHVRAEVSPNKISATKWLSVMREAQLLGLKSTATMMLGGAESISDRVTHLAAIRKLQDETGGFRGFIPWTYQPGFTDLGGSVTSVQDYLRTLAVSRLYLNNFDHVQGSWVTQGKEIGQITLSFGGDDLGSIMIEENVVKATGVTYKMSKEEMVRLIRATGRIPAKRDTKYEILEIYD
ncbi:MAG: dehypoxanthine futalosine cyclase [Actinobacteria bacterium]|nr:dehypoxanthine futalosine cyclase [Actinomycetota bacterium]